MSDLASRLQSLKLVYNFVSFSHAHFVMLGQTCPLLPSCVLQVVCKRLSKELALLICHMRLLIAHLDHSQVTTHFDYLG
jgi:hypothetical protein